MPQSLDQRFGWLRNPIGVLGFLFWMASFKLSVWLREIIFPGLADFTAGYALGFGTAFSGWIVTHLWKGHWPKFVDGHSLWKWFSIFILGIVCLFGLVGALIDLFGDTSGYFNIGFWVGAFVMASCFGPVANEIDGL